MILQKKSQITEGMYHFYKKYSDGNPKYCDFVFKTQRARMILEKKFEITEGMDNFYKKVVFLYSQILWFCVSKHGGHGLF